MKTLLILVSATALISGETAPSANACPVPAPSGADASSSHKRFDPITIDTKGERVATAVPGTCSHAINSKGTGATGRAASADHAINTKGTGAAGRAASADMAIKTKGTGAKREGSHGGEDCDDTDARTAACNDASAAAAPRKDL